MWNLNRPVCWAFDITNFVFWVGIGHAGTLISAILFLLPPEVADEHQPLRRGDDDLRRDVRRACSRPSTSAAPWFAYWLFPYPEPDGHLAELLAARCCGTCSRCRPTPRCRCCSGTWAWCPTWPRFRDRATNRSGAIYIYGILSLGWRGSQRHWHVYEKAYLLLAGLATPLVLSVHSVVSFDFAVSQLPGWHTTIFPPYFVAGAIFSGFAMVVTLAIPARELFGLKDFITPRHLDNMAKIILVTGSDGGLRLPDGVLHRLVRAATRWEQFHFLNRVFGPMWLVRLDHARLQRARPAVLLVQVRPRTTSGCCSSSVSWSTWACGSSGS